MKQLKPNHKSVTNDNVNEKLTILGLVRLLSYEFEKLKFYDNVIFKNSLKQLAKTFELQLEGFLKAYYKDCKIDDLPANMDTLNDLCNVIEKNILISYQLAEIPEVKASEFLDRYSKLLTEYGLGFEKLTVK